MQSDRTYKLGRLSELASKLHELKVKIDGLAKNIIYHFEPLDVAMDYVMTIDPTKLNIYVRDLNDKVREMKKVKAEMDALRGEVGEGS